MNQAEFDALKMVLFEAFSLCAWEALLVCRSFRITLSNATLYRIYVGERP